MKQLRLNILRKKLGFVEEDDTLHTKLMGILEYWIESTIVDAATKPPEDESELTWYHTACTILVPLLKGSKIDMLE